MVRSSGSIGGQRLRRLPHIATAIGDSRVQAVYQDGARLNYSALSPLNWANALLGQRLVIGPSFGVAGDRTDQMRARIDAAIGSGAGLLYVQGGVNDLAQGYAAPGIAANLIAMAEKGRRAGMTVVVEMEVGSGGMADAGVLGRLADLNRLLRDYAERAPGVYLHDARPAVIDAAAGDGANAYKAGYSFDATHPNARGASRWGESLAGLLAPLVPARPSPLLVTRAEANPANGRRQIAINPLFANGTGGTLVNGATGTVPAGWQGGAGASGPSVAFSSDANAVGRSVTCDIGFGQAGETAFLNQEVPIANWQAGDVLQVVADVEIVAPAGLVGIYATLDSHVDTTSRTPTCLFTPSGAGYLGPDRPMRLTLMTRPLTIAAGAKGWLIAGIRAAASGAGNATVRIHQIAVLRRSDLGY